MIPTVFSKRILRWSRCTRWHHHYTYFAFSTRYLSCCCPTNVDCETRTNEDDKGNEEKDKDSTSLSWPSSFVVGPPSVVPSSFSSSSSSFDRTRSSLSSTSSSLLQLHSYRHHHSQWNPLTGTLNNKNNNTSLQRKYYHATSQQPLVLYGAIIIVSATVYVIYRKVQGKPISPDSLIEAKREYDQTQGQFSRAAFQRRQQEKLAQQQQQKEKNSISKSSSSNSTSQSTSTNSSPSSTTRREYHTSTMTGPSPRHGSSSSRSVRFGILYSPNNVSITRRGLAAWNAKWKQKAPRKKPHKRKSADQQLAETLKLQLQRKQQKIKKKQQQNRKLFHDIDTWMPAGNKQQQEEGQQESFIPPAVLLPTGSPYAYVAKSAAQAMEIDPSIDIFPFDEMQQEPPLFRGKTFVYHGVETFVEDTTSRTSTDDGTAGDNVSGTKQQRSVGVKNVPQVAFLGRSNVGKSSLVNALMNRELARCSKQPGRTQQVHRFALVNPKDGNTAHVAPMGMFLDLPGYGFAVAPDAVLEDWQQKTQNVLQREYHQNGNLRRIFVLIDARQGVTPVDETVLEWLQYTGQMPYTLVWTKTDAVSKPHLIKTLNQAFLRYEHEIFASEQDDMPCYMSPIIHTTSTKGKGWGLIELLSAIEAEFLVVDE